MGRVSWVWWLLVVLPTVSAALPTLDQIALSQTSYSPTENSTTLVRIDFNVTDLDGANNLDDSACQCQIDNSPTWQALYESAFDNLCDKQIIDADTVQYTCLVAMQYWYENNTYSVNVTAKDNESSVSDLSQTFTYSLLLASVLDTPFINFGIITSSDYSTTKTDLNSPLVITNTGNQPLNLKITGAALTDIFGQSPNLNASQFSVKNDSSPASALPLTNSQQAIPNTLVPVEDATPGGNDEELWCFFSIPAPFRAGNYSGSWLLSEE